MNEREAREKYEKAVHRKCRAALRAAQATRDETIDAARLAATKKYRAAVNVAREAAQKEYDTSFPAAEKAAWERWREAGEAARGAREAIMAWEVWRAAIATEGKEVRKGWDAWIATIAPHNIPEARDAGKAKGATNE